MGKQKVIDSGVVKKIEYTDKYVDGIFLVTENKQVKRNCKILNIDLGDNVDPNELKQRVTKLEKTGLLTTRVLNQHFQYIIKDYADKDAVNRLINDCPPQSREALTTAYNLTKMDNLEDLEFLGSALDNKN